MGSPSPERASKGLEWPREAQVAPHKPETPHTQNRKCTKPLTLNPKTVTLNTLDPYPKPQEASLPPPPTLKPETGQPEKTSRRARRNPGFRV